MILVDCYCWKRYEFFIGIVVSIMNLQLQLIGIVENIINFLLVLLELKRIIYINDY